MLRTVKTMPRIIFAQRFAESLEVTERIAITNGTHQKIAINTNIPGPIAISPDIIFSIMPGSIKDKTLWADIATAIKIHSTEILIFRVKVSIIYFPPFFFAEPNRR